LTFDEEEKEDDETNKLIHENQ